MRSRNHGVPALLVALGLAIGLAGGATHTAFFATTSNNGNSITADPDWTAPSASGSVIMRDGGNFPGYVRQGGQYYVYANVTDSGNPPSGIASVTADVSSVTTGQTAAPLTAGSWIVAGVTYNYRSALLTVNALAPGAKPYSLTMTDVRTNSATQGGFVVTVDNTRPSGSDIQTANLVFVAGHAETGDTITFTYTEMIDPYTIMAGWDGSATSVTVRIANGPIGDTLQVRNGATTLPFGTIWLMGDYATNPVNFTGSTMIQSGPSITITLGIPDRPARLLTETDAGTIWWIPSTTPTDIAGNACQNTLVNESGAADVEF